MKIAQYFVCKLESKKHSYQKLLNSIGRDQKCHLDFIVILCEKFVLAFIWNNASKLTVRQNGWHALCFWGFSAVITNASEGGLQGVSEPLLSQLLFLAMFSKQIFLLFSSPALWGPASGGFVPQVLLEELLLLLSSCSSSVLTISKGKLRP